MTMVYTYYVAMGAAIWQAGTMDHDGGLGACIKEGGVGSGAISYAHLPESEQTVLVELFHYHLCAN